MSTTAPPSLIANVIENQQVGETIQNVKSHFRHFCRGFREMRLSAKMPILALRRPAGQGGKTAKFPAHRQKCRQIHEMAFPEKVPFFHIALTNFSQD